MSAPAKLVVKELQKNYGTSAVLSNLSLNVGEGEFVSIIGPNASGKSTLLKTIAGIIKKDGGTIEVGALSYMPQEDSLLPWRTARENLLLPSDIANTRAADEARADKLLTEFGLQEFAHSFPATLSGGTRQKIALLRTVLREHSLLLLDEPFAALDAISRVDAQRFLQAVGRKTGATVLLVTHDIREAIFLSNFIYVMQNGKLSEKISVPLPVPRMPHDLQNVEALAVEKQLFSMLFPNL